MMFEPVKVNFGDAVALSNVGRTVIAYGHDYDDTFVLNNSGICVYKGEKITLTELNRLVIFGEEFTFIWMKEV